MKSLGALAGITLTCAIVNLAFAMNSAGAGECTLKRLGSADLIVVDNRLMVQVAIDGRPARMELDTSSPMTLISSSYVGRFGLRAYTSDVKFYFGGRELNQVVPVPKLVVGSQRFGKWKLWRVPDGTLPRDDNEPEVGRVGIDVLAAADFELDFAHNKLNFYSQDHCPGAVVYWTNDYSSAQMTRGPIGVYSFPIELDGKTVQAIISTGLSGTTMSTDDTRRLFGFDETSKGVATETDGAGRSVAYYRAMTLAGEGIRIENAKIRLEPNRVDRLVICTNGVPQTAGMLLAGGYSACEGKEPALYLGLNIARRLHLYFATKERVLYFSEAAASK